MPSGDFTNPRYLESNKYKSDKELYNKHGYVPRVNSDDYDNRRDYTDALKNAKKYGYDERDFK